MLEILRKRRSIRKYTNNSVESWKIDVLKEAVLRSPSSKNIQPWEFIFVSDPDLIEKLADSKTHGSDFLKGAALGIIFVADPEKSDVWVEDCSIASTITHLTAQSLDLGSCWIQIRNRTHKEPQTAGDYIKQVLGIPDKYMVESIIAVGYPGEDKKGLSSEKLEWSKIHDDRF